MAAAPSRSTARPSATSANGFLPISLTRFRGAVTSTPRTWSLFDGEADASAADLPSTGGSRVKPGNAEKDAVAPQTLRFLADATAEGELTGASKIAMVTRSRRPR